MIKKITILALLLFLSASQYYAGVSGKLKGTIKDADTGEPLIGANIMIEGTTMGAASDENGEYFIINIPPGKYNVIASYISYQRQKITNIEIFTDRTTEQNIQLSSTLITTEEIVVSGERAAIEIDRTNTAAYISSEQISNLPVQDVTDIIQLQSGVVKGANGALHIRGGRSGEINYMIDGVSVTDQYRGGSSIGLENNWVQELQVISGTFNAEYGQAQSGVINIVTKEGSKKFGGSASVAFGDYISSRDDVFMNIDKLNLNEIDASINLTGPLPFIPNTSYYTSFRYNDKEGWLYGQRRTRIEDTVPIQAYISEAERNQSDNEKLVGIKVPDSLQTGDNAFVPLNSNERYSFYGKFSNKLTNNISVRYSIFYNYRKYKSYSDFRRYAPDGVKPFTNNNYNHIFNFNHVLSASSFYTVNFSIYSQNIKTNLFDDRLDSRYQGIPHADQGFAFGGTNNSRSDITNSALTVKIDFTSQIDKANQIKIGASFKKHKLDFFTMSTISDGLVYEDPNLRVPQQNTENFNRYINEPYEAVLYAQDKIELDELIVNVGARLDYWSPNAKIPSNPRAITDPNDGIRLQTEFEDADDRFNVSPRFGLAYPLSANGVVHVSYGHFFQLPRFNAIFSNSEFEVSLGGLNTIMGNANLKPEQTVNYELGLQQVISDILSVDFTMYYKDIRNLLSQEIINTSDKKVYARYINRDYGNVKGFTVALKTLSQSNFFAAVDYTYQVGKGNASDPNTVFTNFQSNPPRESEKQVLPLDWDQAHTLNASLYVGDNVNWSLGLISRYSTGQPYTPTNPSSELTEQFENSERKPDLFNIDLNFYKNFDLYGYKLQLFCKVFNLLDGLNASQVYSSTGNPDAPYRSAVASEIVNLNPNFTKDEIDNRPDFYLEPRRVLLGVKLEFSF